MIVDQLWYCMEDCHWRSERKELCGCFVLHALTAEQEKDQVAGCQDLIETEDSDPDSFKKIVTGDESWCFVYDPSTTWQSSAWVGENSLRPKKLWFQKSQGKIMLVIFFDWQGVVHKEFVLWILQKWWTDFWNDFDARPDKAQSGKWYFTTTTTTTIITTPSPSFYSPDLAPAAYFLFNKVKSSLKGRWFDTILDIQNKASSELKEYSTSWVLWRK